MDSKQKDLQRKRLGAEGEEQACRVLQERGHEILRRNFRAGHKEIDIICRDGADLRFVEVKTRREPVEGEAWEAVDMAKQRRIARAAGSFLSSLVSAPEKNGGRRFYPEECHFDIITIVWDRDGNYSRTDYIQDAFYLMYT